MFDGRSRCAHVVTILLLVVTIGAHQPLATTYLSAEPIPSADLVGADTLALIKGAGYANLELWGNRLLNECGLVEDVIKVLTDGGAISTIHAGNTDFLVAAGGFEGATNPSFVATITDSGPGAASTADVGVLSRALGYVLNQSSTAHFSPDDPKAYDFSLDYAVVSFAGTLTGMEAADFFEYVGTIDGDLFSGLFAGFTQIAFRNAATNNSMLFLKPATSKRRLIDGLSAAASTTEGASYVTLNNNGRPTTAKAGVSFPENDWIAFPNGDQYLSGLGTSSPKLLSDLAALRDLHVRAVRSLVGAIEAGNVSVYLNNQFQCPASE
jgi:hypothetical protein